MTTEVDALILRYLQDLEAALHDLPANRRRELLDEVGEHIATARAALDPETEAGVRGMLERLGDPADIAAEARERFGVPSTPARPATPWLEVVALVVLVIPFLGWIVGVVLVWLSRLWTTRDKLIGTIGGLSWILAGLGTVMAPIASRMVPDPGSVLGSDPSAGLEPTGAGGLGPIEALLFLVPFVLPIAAAIYLGFQLRRRVAAVPGDPSS